MNHTYNDGMLEFTADDWSGTVFVAGGANLISLRHNSGLDILRTPKSLDDYWESPEVWGSPVLFPPNRISGARFTYRDKEYNLPANDPRGNNHLHGMLSRRAWEVASVEDDKICLRFENSPKQDCFKWFAHEFTAELTYTFFPAHVTQKIVIRNNSKLPMPLGFAFHTAFRLSFTTDSEEIARQTIVLATVDDFEWERVGFFPSGKQLPHVWDWEKGFTPEGNDVSVHTPVKADKSGFRGAIIESPAEKIRITYEISPQFGQWVLWNFQGDKQFFCPEPQTWMIDAPNLPFADEQTGMAGLEPGEAWDATNNIRVSML